MFWINFTHQSGFIARVTEWKRLRKEEGEAAGVNFGNWQFGII